MSAGDSSPPPYPADLVFLQCRLKNGAEFVLGESSGLAMPPAQKAFQTASILLLISPVIISGVVLGAPAAIVQASHPHRNLISPGHPNAIFAA
jgi:hypothetical protein